MAGHGDPITHELHRWFFDDYMPNWVAVGVSELEPEALLSYWDVPMHIAGGWLMTAEAVTEALRSSQAAIKGSGYTHTDVIDHEIVVYNDDGGSVDAIFSRRRADDSEIQRVAAHFEIHRTRNGWRVVTVATAPATSNVVDEVWRRSSALLPGESSGST